MTQASTSGSVARGASSRWKPQASCLEKTFRSALPRSLLLKPHVHAAVPGLSCCVGVFHLCCSTWGLQLRHMAILLVAREPSGCVMWHLVP